MPFEGGTIFSGQSTGLGGEVVSAAATVAAFRARIGGCDAGVSTSLDTVDDETLPVATDFQCDSTSVRHIVIEGAGHAAPYTGFAGGGAPTLRASRDFDWLDEVIDFAALDE